MTSPTPPLRLAVLGAGGRAGVAITATALARGHQVAAIVRHPVQHRHLSAEGASIVAGDALDLGTLAAATVGADALVSAVTPFTTPPPSFDGFDTDFYRKINSNIVTAARANGIPRVIIIGLFATLYLPTGGMVADDERLFPPALRSFATAHAAGVIPLEGQDADTDWLVLSPPADLSSAATVTGRYQLGSRILDHQLGSLPLSYVDLASAVVDQIEHPTRHREHLAVYGV
ncbi:MAG: NAD(P)H-binding protein [Propionibacteriales bacterium]|nr:NAD(P)H-binding protein [Propionibacteriales bacterium]